MGCEVLFQTSSDYGSWPSLATGDETREEGGGGGGGQKL